MQNAASQPEVTPVRCVQDNLPRLLSSPSTSSHCVQVATSRYAWGTTRLLSPSQYLSVFNYNRTSSGALTLSFCPLDPAASVSEESLSEPAVTPICLQQFHAVAASPQAIEMTLTCSL